jgi:segregation and condensation protein A
MYTLKTEKFKGPFNLLLQLIEKEKLDITEFSLAQVADEFLKHINNSGEISSQELADFLEIAAKLLLIKSRLLIPGEIEEEEGDEDLINQLKIYRQYAQASKQIEKMVLAPTCSFSRDKISLELIPDFSLRVKITPSLLEKYFKNFVEILSRQKKINQETFKRKIVSLKSKIIELLGALQQVGAVGEVVLNTFIKKKSRSEKVVLFLAALELVRRHQAIIVQDGLFKEIRVKPFKP